MKRAAIYIRVSTQAQAQEGDSLAAQREALVGYIKAHPDMVLAGEYMDDGISGQKYEQRDELQRMLTDVREGKIDLIICTKMDRLHRSLKHFLDMQETLDKYKVPWLAIWEPMYDTATPAGQLIINQMMSFAQFEAQNTGARIRQVVDYKISQGQVVSGKVPCGYRIQNKRMVPNEIAPHVKTAFETYSRLGNLQKTMDYCSSLPGLPRFHGAFRDMLTNRKYIGEHRGNPNYCPPIIDTGLFEDVQRKLGINIKRSQIYCNTFSGLLWCQECGFKMSVVRRVIHNKGSEKIYAYYRCQRHFAPPKTCGNKAQMNEKKLEDYLVAHLKEEIADYVFEVRQSEAPRKDTAKRIADLKRKIDRLKELYVNELISLEEYRTDKEKYVAEITALETEPVQEQVDTSALEKLLSQDIRAYYDTLTKEERRCFWRSIVKEIWIDEEKNIRVVFL